MKTIGIIGGMSWQSTTLYYRWLNEELGRRLGGLHSAEMLLFSVDFAPIAAMMSEDRWADAGRALAQAARRLERGGADFILLATNTLHEVATAIAGAVAIPLLHIADPTAAAVRRAGHQKVGLLATAFTMERAFYRDRLERAGLEVLVPGAADRALVHHVIFDELCLGKIEPASRAAYRDVVLGLVAGGAQAVILGCTEVTLLLKPEDSPVPLFDTAALHVQAAVDMALA